GRPGAAVAAPGDPLPGLNRESIRRRRELLFVLAGRILDRGHVRGERLVKSVEMREQNRAPVRGADHERAAEAGARGAGALDVARGRRKDRTADAMLGREIETGVKVPGAVF